MYNFICPIMITEFNLYICVSKQFALALHWISAQQEDFKLITFADNQVVCTRRLALAISTH